MRRVFITGSADGLGLEAARLLADQGHNVVLHARNAARAREAESRLQACAGVVIGDVSTIGAMQSVADQANALGPFDAVIHNVAIGTNEERVMTADGITRIFAVNVVAPYVLTASIATPKRLIYLSSDMHERGNDCLDDPQWESRPWNASQAYADTKLYDLALAMFLAGRWPGRFINALSPGWVPTRMGGKNAPDSLIDGVKTQAWLAVSDEPGAKVTGSYFFHQKPHRFKSAAARADVHERLLEYLRRITGIALPQESAFQARR